MSPERPLHGVYMQGHGAGAGAAPDLFISPVRYSRMCILMY